MEFEGRVKQILPMRSGVSQRTGNEWKALPFVFEYFENQSDRYADTVVLETFDTKVIDNLKEGMEVRCGFGHRTREYNGNVYNELRLYKIESVRRGQQGGQGAVVQHQTQQPMMQTQQPATAPHAAAPFPPVQPAQEADDLPF